MADYPHPIFQIIQNGSDITSRLQSRLISLTLTDNRGYEADQLEIVLDDSDGKLDLPLRGTELTLALGWRATGLIPKGTYTVDQVEHTGAPDQLTITARSADLRAGLTQQKERSWHGLSVGDIVRKIAKDNGLKAIVADPFNLKSIAHIDQTNESDISFLTRISRMFDALVNVKAGNLVFMGNNLAQSASGKALSRVYITRQDGDSHRFTVADRDGATAVKALYQDTRTATKGEVIIDETNIDKVPVAETTPTVTETTSGKSYTLGKTYGNKASASRAAREKFRALKKGKTIYASVVAKYREAGTGNVLTVTITEKNLNKTSKGERKTKEMPPALKASADNLKVLRHIYANKENATRAAKSEFRRMMRGVVSFSLTLANGRPEISPEVPVTVMGWKLDIDNTEWLVSRALHHFSSDGLKTHLDLEMGVKEI